LAGQKVPAAHDTGALLLEPGQKEPAAHALGDWLPAAQLLADWQARGADTPAGQ
jgi:hypothetical protein